MQKSNQLAEAEREKAVERESKLQQEVEFKTKELSTHALNLIQKKEFAGKAIAVVHEMQNKTKPDDALHKELHDLMRVLNYYLKTDNEWEKFHLYFNNLNQNFFDNLVKAYPNLSIHEQKLCAFIKMNLTNKEIASILGISTDSVKVAKYRLKKKMGLESGVDLYTHVSSEF